MENALKDTFGLDIRDSVLTAVELSVEKDGFKVVNYSRVELEPGIIDEDSILLNPEAFKEAVQKLLKNGHEGAIKSSNVIISIPEEKTFSHYIKVPSDQADHHKTILQNAKDLIPIELNEAVIDYKRLQYETDKKEIGFDFVAVQKSIIQPLVDTLQEAGLRVVAIDVDKNSLMRACHPYKKEDRSSMLVQVNHERSLLSVKNNCGISHALTLSLGQKVILEKIKDNLKLESTANAKEILHSTGEKNDAIQKAQAIVNEFYVTLTQKAEELHKMIQSEGCPEIDNIFIVEMGMKWPGLKEALKKVFPKTNIPDSLECVQIGEGNQRPYFNAIGLALRAVLQEVHEQEINLLPHTKKEEFHASKLRPKLNGGFMFIFLALAGLAIFIGMATAKSYFDYMASNKEVDISLERISNPYLSQVAQVNQQKSQLENQVKSILKNNIPINEVIKKIDSYNLNGICLVNAAYKLALNGSMDVYIRAKTMSREETEKFILHLDQEPVFAEVNSPLSNLVGKGERFIQLNLVLNIENFLSNIVEDGESVEFVDTTESQGDAVEAEDLQPLEDETNDEPTEEPTDISADDPTEELDTTPEDINPITE